MKPLPGSDSRWLVTFESPLYRAICAYLYELPMELGYSDDLPPRVTNNPPDIAYGELESLAIEAQVDDSKFRSRFPNLFCQHLRPERVIRGFSFDRAIQALGKGSIQGNAEAAIKIQKAAAQGDARATQAAQDIEAFNHISSSVQNGYLRLIRKASELNRRVAKLDASRTKSLLLQFCAHARFNDKLLFGPHGNGFQEFREVAARSIAASISFEEILNRVDQTDAFLLQYWLHPELSLCLFTSEARERILRAAFRRQVDSTDLYRTKATRLGLVSLKGRKLSTVAYTAKGLAVHYPSPKPSA